MVFNNCVGKLIVCSVLSLRAYSLCAATRGRLFGQPTPLIWCGKAICVP